ncbi:hypothetical protein FSPOR_11878 [Fusarium sporotrichioides]|uniref:Uncharacterized protein n=1 Tax=Fusarium sporotrichioides TaxID=5514 RepID=A0A395RF86_FUSSP|nr:hypothetical protein FSPOR_11878 [Fusarium sporotrichioides]
MLLLSRRRAVSWWTKSVLGNHTTTKSPQDDACTRLPGYSHSSSLVTYRLMSARDVLFKPSKMYEGKMEEKLQIIDLVLSKALPNAAGAVVINVWHTSRSDKRVHCTVDYVDERNRRLIREHIIQRQTKKT